MIKIGKKLFLNSPNKMITNGLKTFTNSNINEFLNSHDKTQVALLNEECILVNEDDHITGNDSKKNCHLLTNINSGMLHRAFSVFLFDENNRMLLQQRSNCKITYPNLWTNTCCSHPLYIKEDLDEKNGIKNAAKRRLFYEFGINVDNHVNEFKYITRIHYKALNEPEDNLFGEHEIDYILFLKGNFNLNHNKNEIKDYKYVSLDELKLFLNQKHLKFTPWFKMICENEKFMFKWWSNLDNLENIQDHKTIHRF